jgi:hypothetical protein
MKNGKAIRALVGGSVLLTAVSVTLFTLADDLARGTQDPDMTEIWWLIGGLGVMALTTILMSAAATIWVFQKIILARRLKRD